MRPNGKKLLYTMGLMVTLSIFIGCGSGDDIFDERATRYNAYALPYDIFDDDSTNEIDISSIDCDTNPNDAIVDFESLFPFDVRVTVTSESDTTATDATVYTNPDFRVEAYTYTLEPRGGSYPSGATMLTIAASLMPDLSIAGLNPRTRDTSSPVITPGSSVELDLPIWSAGDKLAYVSYVNTYPPFTGVASLSFLHYDVQVVLHCRTVEGDTFNITADWTEVVFGPYDTCANQP
jgi:hypothetical protein